MDLSTSQPIRVDLPERATIFELTMTSPGEGWLVGAIFATDHRTLESGLILRYHDHAWRPVDDPLPIAFLDAISMVSPDEGWVTGYSQNKRQSYLLHYTGGHWRQVAVPYQPTDGKYYGGIRMRSPDEGWIMVCPESTRRGQIESLLLHYRDGAWTPVAVPTPLVCDFVPVGPGDLWIVGNASTRLADYQDSLLAHYQQGRWSTTPAPVPAWLSTLRMQSAAAGYAVGWQPPHSSRHQSSLPPAVVLRYDGTTWRPIHTGADSAAQEIVIFDDQDAWAFVRRLPPRPLTNEVFSAVQRTAGTLDLPWRVVDWPFTDIVYIGSMVRAAPGEYWAAASYEVPPGAWEDHHRELLHFVDGAWHEYPPR